MATAAFPSLVPRRRAITAGEAPIREFSPASGQLYRQLYGDRPQPFELTLIFPNAPDLRVSQVFAHYRACGVERFTIDRTTMLAGIRSPGVLPSVNVGYFYAAAPTVSSVRPRFSTLSVRLFGCFSDAPVGTVGTPADPPAPNYADFGPLPEGETSWDYIGEVTYIAAGGTGDLGPGDCEPTHIYTNTYSYGQTVSGLPAGSPMMLRFYHYPDAICEGNRGVYIQRSHNGGATWLGFSFGNAMAWSNVGTYVGRATAFPTSQGSPAVDAFWLEYDMNAPFN